ncbi:hypothetical protein N7468_001653 [Penicillium chermesinum]|uniref:ABC transporter domain-containing protein n=1 Tax=Penicillium chermesinum TaxID=63820 RepID=A0A9W9TWZ0_9EURO|nr:uncharacterized protein N7468_001653 [Penicillium chermesinum]KAJ5246670.1 hypothetical protein N7468_001653 [Penicillium chermesinum]KAJ6144941.1 hypothetical protein N7470_008836 [Penicillium chermesinum]
MIDLSDGRILDSLLLNKWTVRENIDFFATSSDNVICDALKAYNTFSHGQRQLVCLTRAIVRHGNVLVCDKATRRMRYEIADIDKNARPRIHCRCAYGRTYADLIRSHFLSSAILAITHRSSSVLDFDRVLVMEEGRIV